MPKNNPVVQKIIEIVEPVLASSGYGLVDVEFQSVQGGWAVRVYIEVAGPNARQVTFADCEDMSREISAVLDVEDPVPHAYNLEVSSPGVDRSLRTAEHFQRFNGSEVKITMGFGVDGRRNFRGILTGFEPASNGAGKSAGADDLVCLRVDGVDFRLPLADVVSARLVPTWDAKPTAPSKPKKKLTASKADVSPATTTHEPHDSKVN